MLDAGNAGSLSAESHLGLDRSLFEMATKKYDKKQKRSRTNLVTLLSTVARKVGNELTRARCASHPRATSKAKQLLKLDLSRLSRQGLVVVDVK